MYLYLTLAVIVYAFSAIFWHLLALYFNDTAPWKKIPVINTVLAVVLIVAVLFTIVNMHLKRIVSNKN